MARHMVCEWGMSDLGPLSFGKVEEELFLGREIAKRVDYSEETAKKIDENVKEIVMSCYERAEKVIKDNINALRKIAEVLLEKEVLNGVEIEGIIQEEKT